MARKKKTQVIESADVAEMTTAPTSGWPKIIQGSHSTRIEHEDGRVDFHSDWEALQRDVRAAIAEYESKNK